MGDYSAWEQRQLDEEGGAELDRMGIGGPAVGGIMWTTCLAPDASVNGGKCFRGVEYKVNGVPTGHTKCEAHR
jgi:hypothetical protein